MANKEKDVKKTSGGTSESTAKKTASQKSTSGKTRRSADEKYDAYDYDEIFTDQDEGADVPVKKIKAPVDTSAPKYQVIPLLMAAISLFIIICYIFPDFCGFIGSGIRSVLYGLFPARRLPYPFSCFCRRYT